MNKKTIILGVVTILILGSVGVFGYQAYKLYEQIKVTQQLVNYLIAHDPKDPDKITGFTQEVYRSSLIINEVLAKKATTTK